MSADRIALEAGAPAVAAADSRGEDRARLAKLAAEFESLLLSSVLRDMRSAGRWTEEDSGDMFGAGAFGQTFDTELARSLSSSGGFGLATFLMKALDRYAANAGTAPTTVPGTVPLLLPTGDTTATPAPGEIATPVASRGQTDASPVVGTTSRGGMYEGRAVSAIGATRAERSTVVLPPDIDEETARATDMLTRPTARLTSAFGWRKDPITGAAKFHRGVDLKAAEGDPVPATGSGRVVFSGRNGGYGNTVVVEHPNGLQTRYAHLSATLVAAGDRVTEGQPIGLAGHTGRATGPHVHYEVLEDGRAVDPLR